MSGPDIGGDMALASVYAAALGAMFNKLFDPDLLGWASGLSLAGHQSITVETQIISSTSA